jgi:4-hydroxy-4-methyl-2-oxoglutarate aldolase
MDVTGLKCADLVDAMGRLHRHRCHILDLVSPTPGRVLFGPAVTISYFPSCSATLDPERYNLANLFYEAVGDEPAGKVLVLASNGYTDTSMGGGTKLLRLQQNGCAGVLTDGRLRDFDELARYDFAAYCSGEATRWGGDSVTPVQANVPVVVDRVAVVPGQYVFADSSGAVVIPDGQIEEVVAEARQVEAADAASRDQIAREGFVNDDRPVVARRLFDARCSSMSRQERSKPRTGRVSPSAASASSSAVHPTVHRTRDFRGNSGHLVMPESRPGNRENPGCPRS